MAHFKDKRNVDLRCLDVLCSMFFDISVQSVFLKVKENVKNICYVN